MKTEFKIWWERAQKDLKSAEKNFEINEYMVAVFLCHQSVEKALKALHIENYNQFPRIHDLSLLAEKVSAPNEIRAICGRLNPIYLDTRYPDFLGDYDKNDVEEILKLAGEVLAWIEKNL